MLKLLTTKITSLENLTSTRGAHLIFINL